MKVAVIGAGYVGLVTAAGLARLGHSVVCVDTDSRRLEAIVQGRAPFYEPGLDDLIANARACKRLDIAATTAAALMDSDVSIIAVGTPSTQAGIDLSFIRQAAAGIGAVLPQLRRYHVVTVKSTVVPTTTDTLVREELEKASGLRAGRDFGLGMNPEFLREGCAVEDFVDPDRIVLGGIDERSLEMLSNLYAGVTCPIVKTSLRNAEMIKYTANCVLATLISFSNEIAHLCEQVPGLDEETVMSAVCLDRRWTVRAQDRTLNPGIVSYLRAGIGFGGSCFPKDLKAIASFAQTAGADLPIVTAALDVNEARADQVIALLRRAIGPLRGKRVAVLGLAFKPDTDDTRESPGVKIAAGLYRQGCDVRVHDPLVTADRVRDRLHDDIRVAGSVEEALAGVDAALVTTAWKQYRAFDWANGVKVMRSPVILDGRQVLNRAKLPTTVRLLTIGRSVDLSDAGLVGT